MELVVSVHASASKVEGLIGLCFETLFVFWQEQGVVGFFIAVACHTTSPVLSQSSICSHTNGPWLRRWFARCLRCSANANSNSLPPSLTHSLTHSGYLIIVSGHNIQKNCFGIFDF